MTVLAIEKRRTKAWWKELWVQVLIAMALGIALGIADPDLADTMQPLGDAFIKAIRMLIAPIIFCTVVHGIAHMADMARVGRVALKAIVYFEVMTTVALVIGLVAVNLLKPGVGMNIDPATINASAVEPYVKHDRRRRLRAVPDEHHSRHHSSAPSRKATSCRCSSSPWSAASRWCNWATAQNRCWTSSTSPPR